jgi:hypothetical protein
MEINTNPNIDHIDMNESTRDIIVISNSKHRHSHVVSRSLIEPFKTGETRTIGNEYIGAIMNLKSDVNNRVVNDNLIKLKNIRKKQKADEYVHQTKDKSKNTSVLFNACSSIRSKTGKHSQQP